MELPFKQVYKYHVRHSTLAKVILKHSSSSCLAAACAVRPRFVFPVVTNPSGWKHPKSCCLRRNRRLFQPNVDCRRVVRILWCNFWLLRTCKPLECISRSILNAITGLVKRANNFEYLVAQLKAVFCM